MQIGNCNFETFPLFPCSTECIQMEVVWHSQSKRFERPNFVIQDIYQEERAYF